MTDDRHAYREFVRTHHPDRGGDPEVFRAGLARFRERDDDGPDRYDAPITVVPRHRGVRAIVHLVRTWWTRRRRPPRVQ